MKILNLFAGIGGNRATWDNHEITAIESNESIAELYKRRFPNDNVIVTDSYQYLLEHFKEYDFIWASPPCQTHSKMNLANYKRYDNYKYPDLRLYEIILFLNHFYDGFWLIENVKPYYVPLIEPTCIIGRHNIWCNINIKSKSFIRPKNFIKANIKTLCEYHNIEYNIIKNAKIKGWTKNHDPKATILRNCVDYRIGDYIIKQVEKLI